MTTGTGRIKTSLLSLPDELLSAILSEVVRTHGSRTATLVSTCRRLAPIVRQEVYWELRVGNDEAQSDVLSELCANRPDLRRLVRVLHVERPIQEVHERKMIVYDYIDVHPCIKLLHSDFPALHTLSVYQATPIDIFTILSRVAATTRPDIRKLTLQCAPGSVDSVYKRHKTIWWHFLARLPKLERLTITTSHIPSPDEILFEHVNGRAVSPLPGLHSLTLDIPMPHNFLARLPRLERLCLHGVDAAVLLPSIRTSHIKHLRISVNATFTDEILLDLVDGPMHMKYLKVLQLDYTYGIDPWANCDLVLAHMRQTQFNLARVKAELSPKWPPGCSREGLRTVLDAARQMGIKVYGTALDCLDWSDRFDELSERLLVDDALASNNYTIIERHLGKEGAEKANVRVSGRDLRS
ncbi:hypothetical protein C6P46_004928 [Rhodotorula mucilaginosa]|uniref:F-box domain-containing protein n=1 Tax=Rhodotorula mucilaginosa TaxID=5537 RepID=A0A9P6W705_RHOMI|nr:hypothetical protein C6P46_004928 [Rhodotorula mucilaginosa]